MRKDLKAAFELAIEHHPVDYYKDILKSFQEELIAQEEALREAAATPKKGKKGKNKAADEEDAEVPDADASAKKSKKRKAEDEVAVSASFPANSPKIWGCAPTNIFLSLDRPPNAPILSRSPRLNLTRRPRQRQQTELVHPSPRADLPPRLPRSRPRSPRRPRIPRRVARRRLLRPPRRIR